MFAARRDGALPKGYGDALLALHDKRPFARRRDEIAARRGSRAGRKLPHRGRRRTASTSINRDVPRRRHRCAVAVSRSSASSADGGHAFYLGAELAKAEIAWRLGKRYAQDEPLDWGCAADLPEEDEQTRLKDPGHTLVLRAERVLNAAHPRDHRRDDECRRDAPRRALRADPRGSRLGARAVPTLARHRQSAPHAVCRREQPADIRIVAGAVTGRRDWPMEPAERVPGVRLRDAFGRMELEVATFADDPTRPRFTCRVVHAVGHSPFVGYNRAQAAMIEAAILVTRLHLLPREKIEAEMSYLKIAIAKTAGASEAEAWGWIAEKVRAHYEGAAAT